MDPGRLQRIRTTFASLEPCGPALVAQVLSATSARHPALDSVIRPHDQGDAAAFNTRMWNGLGRIVEHVGRFRTLEAPLMALGVQAGRQGLRPDHFRTLRAELLGAMGEVLGQDWTPPVRRDWALVLAAVSGAMLRGALQDVPELVTAA
jgi:hemoglobin-like flavoprotein